MTMIRDLLKTLSLTKEWYAEYDSPSDSISIFNVTDSKVICYIQIDEYDKRKPLEITDDCITLNEFDLDYTGRGPKRTGFKHVLLTEDQVHAIGHLLSENGLTKLKSFNEIILDTNQNDINKDLEQYLRTITLLTDLLNIFRDSQL